MTEENAICGQIVPPLDKPIHACVQAESYWTFDYVYGINIDIIILSIDIVLFWVILTLIETNLLNIGWTKLKEKYYGASVSSTAQVDDDVQKEKDSIYANNDNLMRVRRMLCLPFLHNDNCQVINLTKKFDKFEAVRGLTFGVRKNECFGLLGVNGAGKTTTFRWENIEVLADNFYDDFRMITGDEVLTSGQSFIGTISLSHNRAQYLQSIGYCPQFDSIIEVEI